MTLSEIKEKIDSTEGKKLPGASALRMSGSEIIASENHANGSITVYKCGFAIFSSFGRVTVLRVDRCNDYRYPLDEGKEYCPPEMFENEDWKILLTMVGEDRIEHSREESESAQAEKFGDYDYECVDGGDPVADAVLGNNDFENLMVQIHEYLTERQYIVFHLKYFKGLSNNEISSVLHIKPASVCQCLSEIRKKISKNYKKF